MFPIIIKSLDLSKSKVGEKTFTFSDSLDLKSVKSLAYAVRWQLARRRSGSAKTKTMSEISGTTAKPYKQKGTGNARQGSKRSVQFVGGRTCHGPTPRSFDFTMPKKISKCSLADALRLKISENNIYLVNSFPFEKTSELTKSLNKADLKESCLFVYDEKSKDSLIRSARNLKDSKVIDVKAINPYDILNYKNLILEESVFESKIFGVIL